MEKKFVEIKCQYCGRVLESVENDKPSILKEYICPDCVNDICDIMELEYGLKEDKRNYEQDYLSYL